MTTYIIKHLMHTHFDEAEPLAPGQPPILTERIARLGEEVEFSNPNAEKRAKDLGAVYTDEEADQIRKGTYRGIDAENVYSARRSLGYEAPPEGAAAQAGLAEINAAQTGSEVVDDSVGIDFRNSSTEEIGDYIRDQKLTIPKTLALLPEDADEDDVNKLMDAEVHATNNTPRAGVQEPLDKKLTDLSTSS